MATFYGGPPCLRGNCAADNWWIPWIKEGDDRAPNVDSPILRYHIFHHIC
jgi:hypothetical protein